MSDPAAVEQALAVADDTKRHYDLMAEPPLEDSDEWVCLVLASEVRELRARHAAAHANWATAERLAAQHADAAEKAEADLAAFTCSECGWHHAVDCQDKAALAELRQDRDALVALHKTGSAALRLQLSDAESDLARVKEEDRLVMKELERTLKAIGGSDDITAAKQQASHERCHDLVCSGNRDYPRGEKGHTCSCASRDTAFSDLAAARAVLDTAVVTYNDDADCVEIQVQREPWQRWQDGQR